MGSHQGELFLLGLFTLSLHLVPQVDHRVRFAFFILWEGHASQGLPSLWLKTVLYRTQERGLNTF